MTDSKNWSIWGLSMQVLTSKTSKVRVFDFRQLRPIWPPFSISSDFGGWIYS